MLCQLTLWVKGYSLTELKYYIVRNKCGIWKGGCEKIKISTRQTWGENSSWSTGQQRAKGTEMKETEEFLWLVASCCVLTQKRLHSSQSVWRSSAKFSTSHAEKIPDTTASNRESQHQLIWSWCWGEIFFTLCVCRLTADFTRNLQTFHIRT